jgi:hypothetical protein
MIDQNMGDMEQAFLGSDSLTQKPQSRNDGMREIQQKEKQSNLNVS